MSPTGGKRDIGDPFKYYKDDPTFYKDKKVLVAGGTGTIGIPLVSLLLNRGAEVTVVSMDSFDFANVALPKDVRFERADLRTERECAVFTRGMDYVFDMVGLKGSTTSNSNNYSQRFESYLQFQSALMSAAKNAGVSRYLFPGSICEYPQMTTPKREDDLWNGLPIQNDKYVGVVKRIGEFQASAYHEEGSWNGVRIVRLSNVYGEWDDFNPATAQVIPALIAKALKSDHVKVSGDGTAERDFIYVQDAAYWSMKALEKLPTCFPVNLGAGRGISIREVCKTIQEFIKVEFEFDPQSYSGDKTRILSTDRAVVYLGFHERTPFREGIRRTIDWYKQHGDVASLKGKFYE